MKETIINKSKSIKENHLIKNIEVIMFGFLFLSQSVYANWDMAPGSRTNIPVNVTSSYPGASKMEDGRNQMGQITPLTVIRSDEMCDFDLKTGFSSDSSVYGLIIADDILLTFSGNSQNSTTRNNDNNYASWTATDGKVIVSRGNYPPGGWISPARVEKTLSCVPALGYWVAKNSKASFNGNITIYVGPTAKLGSYKLPDLYWNVIKSTKKKIFSGGQLNVISPRKCTIQTDNNITFSPVDITDAKDGQSLGNKNGSFSIRCDDATNSPVSLEVQGAQGRYTDTMALTMTDGSNAPAEIRGFIGSNIPLSGECNGRLSGAKGVVHFTPNAGQEKKTLPPGEYNYNWVLCSTGKYKTGKAKGVAKIIINWD